MEPFAQLLADAGAMTVFGTLLFRAVVADRSMPRLTAAAALAAMGGAAWWLVVQSERFGGGTVAVLTGSWFGQTLAAQVLLITLGAAVGGRVGVVAAGLGIAAGAARGHGVAMDDAPDLVVSLVLHLLAAAAWVGSLPALVLALLDGEDTAARRYGRIGGGAVAALGLSALWQGWSLGGGLPGLIGTPYGAMLGLKTLLFLTMIGFALRHRHRLVPRLPDARTVLAASVAAEAAIGLLAVWAAVALVALPPGMHEQPWWPFAWRPDGFAFSDPDLRREVVGGLLLVALAAGLVLAGRWRRWAWLGVPVALWLGVPQLDLLFVPAYPTSFWREPAPASAASVAQGERLYAEHCVACHGIDKKGDGPSAGTLAIPPADLTAAHLWDHSDGELFWWLTAGMPGPDGKLAMPGFVAKLSEDNRWALIDAIRAANPYRPSSSGAGHHHH